MRALLILTFLCSAYDVNSILFADSYSHECRFYGASRMADLLEQTDLQARMEQDGPVTFFCPENKYFPYDLYTKLSNPKHEKLLKEVLRYHIVNGTYRMENFTNDEEFKTLHNDVTIRTNVYRIPNQQFPTVTVNGANLTRVNIDVKKWNGTVHFTGKLLYPIPSETILSYLQSDSDYTTLLYAISKGNLQSTLSGGPYTVFAPSNKAFEKLPPGDYIDLVSNQTLLQDVLGYHVVSGSVFKEGIYNGAHLTALDGRELKFKFVNGSILLNHVANITSADNTMTNGVIHIIDTLLMPTNLKFKFQKNF